MASVSPLGKSPAEIWQNYKNKEHLIKWNNFNGIEAPAAHLPYAVNEEIEALRISSSKYKSLDKSVLFAIFTTRDLLRRSKWEMGDHIGVNIGSSRGATALFEDYHNLFLKTKKAEVLASPSTTLGNISSWVAQDIQSRGPEISHSVTCSTGLHAVLNGVAWLQAGMASKFIVGGSEAALTPFTIAQMQAMKIYAITPQEYPCRALDMEKNQNTMVLGEAAGVLSLEMDSQNAIAQISGIGYATENLDHPVSISPSAQCLQKSMKMAIGEIDPGEIDAIVMHAPGTIKGDRAEVNAIKEIFGENHPALTSNKWKIGHTFGASGILSIELAILMLQHQEFIEVPFSEISAPPKQLRNILVNAVGFGGNAVSILISKINKE